MKNFPKSVGLPENAVKHGKTGNTGDPDPYHGAHPLIDPLRRTTYPGYPPHLRVLVSGACGDVPRARVVHQASLRYSPDPNIPFVGKPPLFNAQNGPCQN